MKSISGFFDRFRNRAVAEIQNHTTILEILKKNTGMSFEIGDITVSSGTIKVKASQLVKNELFMKKQRIIKEIKEKTGLTVTDLS